jgi:adenosylcobinamide-GDP ribazoletransferase
VASPLTGAMGARPNGLPGFEGAPNWRAGVTAWLQAPFFAVQFLTIVPPVLVRRAPETGDFGRSDAFFPLVGLLLGGLLAGLDLTLAPFVGEPVRNVGLVAVLAILTGALHLDGLIDTFDGIFTGPDAERRLDVMRDPRAGSFGVVAVVLVLGLKVAGLFSLPPEMRMPAIVLAPCLGRWGIALVTRAFPYARPVGMGRSFKDSIRWTHVIVASIIAGGASVALLGANGLLLWIGVGMVALGAGTLVTGRLGGLTGDTYGALCELVEASVLIVLGLRLPGLAG